MSWTKAAKRSTSAGFAARSDVLDKSDRMAATKGSPTWDTLSSAELKQVQEIWGEQDQDYGQFLGRFERKMAASPVSARVENVNDWVAPERNRRTPQERQWQTMTSDIKVTYQRYEPFPCGTERTNIRMFSGLPRGPVCWESIQDKGVPGCCPRQDRRLQRPLRLHESRRHEGYHLRHHHAYIRAHDVPGRYVSYHCGTPILLLNYL